MLTSISAGGTYCSLTTRAVTDRHYAQSKRNPRRRQIPSATLANDGLQRQRYWAQEKHLQQQEEDEWFQSVQAEADADPRNQYWAAFAQTQTAAAPQTSFDMAKQPQMLGTTQLGRQRLQQKADSFADMMHLVASADVKPADRTDRPKVSGARATAATLDDVAATGSDSEIVASTSQTAVEQKSNISLSRHNRQRTTEMQNVSPRTAIGDQQIHLERLQDGSTAALRSYPNHKLAQPREVAGHTAVPQSITESSPISTDHGQCEDCNGLVGGSSATGQDIHPQQGLARAKRLQRLEAAAAKWREKSGSNPISASQLHVLNIDSVTTIPATVSNETTDPPEPQSGQLQRAFGNVESIPSVSQNVDPGARFEAARSEHDDLQSAKGVPPPPSRPSKRLQAKPKATWMAALRGDAPPWLL